MFLAMGVGAFAGGIFHLYTHAFFKALLFLGSGAVIHALAGEQDLRRMGGLKDRLPITYWTFLIGAIAIAGVPGLAGFFSKDEILFETYTNGHMVLWIVGMLTSLLTAIYMFRIVFLAFHGTPQPEPMKPQHPEEEEPAAHAAGASPGTHSTHPTVPADATHLHDAPPAMAVALIVLAVGSIVAGYANLPPVLGGGGWFARFLEPSFAPQRAEAAADHGLELTLMLVSSLVALAGIGIAAYFFLKNRAASDRVASQFGGVQRVLLNKYYVDEIYDAVIVQPIRIVSESALWKVVDARVIDGAVNGAAETVGGLADLMRRLQSGSVRTYAASLFLGVVLILGYYLFGPFPNVSSLLP
jgi:NADH-quinone oxidoreductase subunit L